MRAGQRIGKYVLDERIAVGGMAEVWAGRVEGPAGFTKPVALKFILESFAGDPELERLFVNEARIAARLSHANLVTVFDFDKVGADHESGLAGRYYIAMERVEGQDLRRLEQAARRAGYMFPVGVALHLGGEVLKALRYVHERREHGQPLDLIHRDVSPHNVLVGFSGEVKLSDFGIAKTRAHSARTKTGTVRGKLSYASPEQLGGEPVDHRTDQFALGVTLWETLAGRRLFDGRDDLETIANVVRCAIPPLGAESASGHAVPPAVESVVRRMLSPRREDRFPTTAEALSAVLSLPSYQADGTALSDLMRTLFLPTHVEMPATMPIQALGVLDRQAATRTMEKPAGHPARTPTPAPVAGRATPPTARAAPATASQPSTKRHVPAAGGARGRAHPVRLRRRGPSAAVIAGGLAVVAALVVSAILLLPGRSPPAPVVAGPDPVTAAAAPEGAVTGERPPAAPALPDEAPPAAEHTRRAAVLREAHSTAAAVAAPAPAAQAPAAAPAPPPASAPAPAPVTPSPAADEIVPRIRANKSPVLE